MTASSLAEAMQQLDTAERMLIMRDEADEAQALDFIKLAREVHRLVEPKQWQVSRKDRRAILELASRYILVMGREVLERRLKDHSALKKREEVKAKAAAEARCEAFLARPDLVEQCVGCGDRVGALAIVLGGKPYCAACAKMV